MRIIAGKHKGRRLDGLSVGCKNIRPTSDMAREALFSILTRWPKGAFLDLFSGTGAVALEAVSRGYSPVWCVECDKNAVDCIRKNARGSVLGIKQICNAQSTKHNDRCIGHAELYASKLIPEMEIAVLHKDARNLAEEDFSCLSVIFADPPYDKTLEMWSILAHRLSGFMSPDGVLVWEYPKTTELPEVPCLIPVHEKRYGTTKFHFFERTE